MYTYGIVVLAALTCLLLVLFGGVTDKLIPLYAVGAFLAFTLSQFGMVVHWEKKRGPHWRKSALVNGLGGMVTGVTVIVVLVAKFAEGAWITVIFIPVLILFFRLVRRHYHLPRERTIVGTPEVLVVRSGRCRLDVYDDELQPVESLELGEGDIMVMVGGGHGFEMLEDTVLIEIKQGPYLGADEKEYF